MSILTELTPELSEDGERVWECVAGVWVAQRRPAHVGKNELACVRGLIEFTWGDVETCVWTRPNAHGKDLIVTALLKGWRSGWTTKPAPQWGKPAGDDARWETPTP